MNKADKIFNECFLFCGLTSDEKRIIRGKYINELKIKKGEEISPVGMLLIIVEGDAAVSVKDSDNTVMNKLAPGSLFGCASLYGGEAVTDITAKHDLTLLTVKKDDLEKIFTEHPSVAIRYIEFLSDRIRFLNKKTHTYSRATKDRLIDFLGAESTDGVKMAELARRLGIGRTSLYRAIDEGIKEGKLIKTDKGIKLKKE